MRRLAAAAAAFLFGTTTASAQTLIVTLSTEQVEVTSNFTGTGVTVFGAVEGIAASDAPFDLVVVLRGPSESVSIRRKDRLLGLWVNRAEATFADMPAFYAVHATTPLADITSAATLSALGLGLTAIGNDAVSAAGERDFASALIRLRQEEGVYYEHADEIDRLGGNIFRTIFELPADVPVGAYSVEALLFQDGELLTSTQQPLEIIKTGSEQFIYEASRNQPWLYALAIVMIAAGSGWLGGVLFRRD
jgi:uncharacterized protein (TIGR02186 family)